MSFCTQVEALELSKKLLVGGGAMVIVQRVAEALPVPIGDSLLYRAGFNPSDAVGFWDMTNRQDWQVVELTQLGVRSDVFTPGPYSLEEDLLAAFDREYLMRFSLGDRHMTGQDLRAAHMWTFAAVLSFFLWFVFSLCERKTNHKKRVA